MFFTMFVFLEISEVDSEKGREGETEGNRESGGKSM